jgi:hypothetical protein
MTATNITTVTITLGHRSSIAGARWCTPAGWEPENQIEGAEYINGSWWGEENEEAGIVYFGEGEEGDEITVAVEDLRVASCGDCRVIGPVQI